MPIWKNNWYVETCRIKPVWKLKSEYLGIKLELLYIEGSNAMWDESSQVFISNQGHISHQVL